MLKPVPSGEILNLIHHCLGEQAPAGRVPQPRPEIAAYIPPGERTPLIHVIDDDDRIRTLLATLLESEGCEVAGYPDAESFLSLYRPASDRPECLLLDIVLPQMTGLELQEVLRQRRIDIPTVIITGHKAIRTATQAVLAGAIDVIEKPVRREVLVRALRRGLGAATEQRAATDRQQERAALLAALTVRERQVMSLVVSGLANKEIAYRLGISERTIEGHRRAIMQKMKVKSLADLVRAAGTLGIS